MRIVSFVKICEFAVCVLPLYYFFLNFFNDISKLQTESYRFNTQHFEFRTFYIWNSIFIVDGCMRTSSHLAVTSHESVCGVSLLAVPLSANSLSVLTLMVTLLWKSWSDVHFIVEYVNGSFEMSGTAFSNWALGKEDDLVANSKLLGVEVGCSGNIKNCLKKKTIDQMFEAVTKTVVSIWRLIYLFGT